MIVVLSELRQLLPAIFERRKPLHVQTFVPQSAMETLPTQVQGSLTLPTYVTYTYYSDEAAQRRHTDI